MKRTHVFQDEDLSEVNNVNDRIPSSGALPVGLDEHVSSEEIPIDDELDDEASPATIMTEAQRKKKLGIQVTRTALKQQRKELDEIRLSREIIGCYCTPPPPLAKRTIKVLQQFAKDHGVQLPKGNAGRSKKAILRCIEEHFEKQEATGGTNLSDTLKVECCLPGSDCPCVQNNIDCFVVRNYYCQCYGSCENPAGLYLYDYDSIAEHRKEVLQREATES